MMVSILRSLNLHILASERERGNHRFLRVHLRHRIGSQHYEDGDFYYKSVIQKEGDVKSDLRQRVPLKTH